ncbi:MAG: exopolyphosphatase [Ectothiorhodospiraceae bacterium]|nr:exopolyphosphatase [Chromatiales bacterium]MCP5155346.1 exopolyphosphatase [Ectothiorhodospiraceae bacterium]
MLAAVDLGSNSFHLVVARVSGGDVHVIDRLREPVRLGAGLDADKQLTPAAFERGLACLARFGERLRTFPREAVRAVGTNALRVARNGAAFLEEGEGRLGHRIEVIAGREEARLIYLGVAHSLAADRHRRLVVDIGGGSTELIVGEGFEPVHRESLFMGCVSMTERFFPDGKIDKVRMQAAELAARAELEPVETRFRAAGWEGAVGCSGTIRAIAGVAQAAGWCGEVLTRRALARVRKAAIDAGDIRALSLKELKDDRRPVFAGGLAVLTACFGALGIEEMAVSAMALREGVLFDLLGRIRHEDVRDRTVRALAERHHVDLDQAARVERTAEVLRQQVANAWNLADEESEWLLGWAAKLHEIGLAVSHTHYHKHGAYLIANADMAGFSRREQGLLAALVRAHRRKLPSAVFDGLPSRARTNAQRLCLLLRLAVVLHRSRSPAPLPRLHLTVSERGATLEFPARWLEAHPLTRTDFEQEARFLSGGGFALTLR